MCSGSVSLCDSNARTDSLLIGFKGRYRRQLVHLCTAICLKVRYSHRTTTHWPLIRASNPAKLSQNVTSTLANAAPTMLVTVSCYSR